MNNWLLISMAIAFLVIIISCINNGDDNQTGFQS
jgi:hypothetical protein